MKKNTVIAIITAAAALFSASSMANGLHGCPTKNTIFSSYNSKDTKAVELCDMGNGQYRYSYGPRHKPELVLTKPRSEVRLVTSMAGGFSLQNGPYSYGVDQDKYGNGSLSVYKGNKLLADIKLDVDGPGYVDRTFDFK